MNRRRSTYVPTTRATISWLLLRICIAEAALAISLGWLMAMHAGGAR